LQERVIENWLTNVNELRFTIPFAQILALQGHTILYISPKKATLEQGKDIISKDSEGVVHCFQLKGGDITLSRWRSEVKPEIDALIDLPPRHPSLPANCAWVCHLIVNGDLKGEATREITDYQHARIADNRRSFDVEVRGQLQRHFTDAYGSYLPTELDDFAAFLDVYRQPGLEPIIKPQFSRLVETFLDLAFVESSKPPTKTALVQQINAAIVSVSYLLANKYRESNYIAIIEGWLLLLGYIFSAAEKNGLDPKRWRPSTELVERVIDTTIEDLLGELDQRTHFAQPANVPYSEAYVYRDRVTIVAAYLAAYSLYLRLNGSPNPAEDRIRQFLDKTISLKLLSIQGEGQMPLMAMVALYYHLADPSDQATELLVGCIAPILVARDKGGMYDPYIDLQDVIRTDLQITLKPADRIRGNSYALWPLVLLLAYLGRRDVLTSVWREISHVGLQEFKPAMPWQWFFWNCALGRQEGRYAPAQQSWAKLVTLARTPDDLVIAKFARENPGYIPLFFCLMPHRMSGYAMRTLLASLPDSGDVVQSSPSERLPD
jgi:hypothetical protein